MTTSVHRRALALGPIDPDSWLPPRAAPYPPPWRGVGRRPSGGPLLADLRGRYQPLVDAHGDAPLNKVHKALARQMRDDFLTAWRIRLGLDPTVPLQVIAPAGARRVGALVAEPQPEQLFTVLSGSLVSALTQNPGAQAQSTEPTLTPVPDQQPLPGPTGTPMFDYPATTSRVRRNQPEPLPVGLLAVAPDGRRQPQMRDGVRSFVADAYLDGTAGLPATFFAGRPGLRSRPATCQDLLLRVDRGYASGTERAAFVAGHAATVDDLAAAVVAHFGAHRSRVEWGMSDPAGEHAGLTSRDAQVPRCLLRLAIGSAAGAGVVSHVVSGAASDPRYGPLLHQTAPTPVWSVLAVGWAAWIRVVDDGSDEWFSVRALAAGPSGRCCPADVTLVTSTLPVAPAA